MLAIIQEIILTLGLSLAVGSSTVVLTLYIAALSDGVIDASEKRFLHIVYKILRTGKTLIILGLLMLLVQPEFYVTNTYIAQWFFIGVLIINAILMTKHKISMRIGPILAGGSWYSLFFVSAGVFAASSLFTIVMSYVVFLIIFYFGYTFLMKKYTNQE